ncbi:hypothetical protein [Streptomyces sp. NBC_01174]|uniref:hypothetical protein n=1 Tax=Streptomyces sp. NBC_01174 TaxID=2903758 RepID=UPI0038669C88|nr:hypothetical protein OG414_28925 [Streptomyces sp. NBC_01174]
MESPVTFDRLYEGAKRFARLAMEAHADEDQEVFLLHAGVSVERLAKAALVLVHPILLTEVDGKDDMLLHLAGAVAKAPARLRTIGASTAIGRLRKMDVLPQKPSSEADDLDGLIELRNGVAHLGTGDVEDYLATFTATVVKLLRHMRQDRGSFWETWLALYARTGFWHRSWGAVAERDIVVRLRVTGSYETAYALSPDSRK